MCSNEPTNKRNTGVQFKVQFEVQLKYSCSTVSLKLYKNKVQFHYSFTETIQNKIQFQYSFSETVQKKDVPGQFGTFLVPGLVGTKYGLGHFFRLADAQGWASEHHSICISRGRSRCLPESLRAAL